MAVEDADTSRARIQTYVPEYQKEEWQRHADEMDMSLSEFVRSMVQAGRRGFEGGESESGDQETATTPSSSPDPQGADLEERVVEALSEDEYVDWDEIVASVTDDVEQQIENVLQKLSEEGHVQHSPRHGGYALE